MLTFSIGEVSQKLGIPTHTLRFWEKELAGILIPFRTEGGQRRYTNDHLVIINQIKGLKEKGLSLAQIKAEMYARQQLGDSRLDFVDQLAEEIAQAVRSTIYNFIQKQTSKPVD